MKATENAYRKLEEILNAYGFCLKESTFGKQVSLKEGTAYVSIQVREHHDSFEGEWNKETFREHGHLELTASICRMGGEMSAEDFREAADQMDMARLILETAAEADLSYTANAEGEAA